MVFLCGCEYKLVKIPIFFSKIFGHVKKKQYLCIRFRKEVYMVAIAQLAEHRIVVPSVVGSSPTSHPKKDAFESVFFVLYQIYLYSEVYPIVYIFLEH